MPVVLIADRDGPVDEKGIQVASLVRGLMTPEEERNLQFCRRAWWNSDTHRLIVEPNWNDFISRDRA
jgi:hypothetical protein